VILLVADVAPCNELTARCCVLMDEIRQLDSVGDWSTALDVAIQCHGK